MVMFSPDPSESPVEIMQSVQTTKIDRAPINDISEVCTVSPFEMPEKPEKPKKGKKTNSYGNRMRVEINDIAIELPEGFRLQDLPLLIGILKRAE